MENKDYKSRGEPYLTAEIKEKDILEYISTNPDSCLRHTMGDGKIDLDGVELEMKQSRKREFLKKYKGEIKKLNGKTDKRYYIRLKDLDKSGGRYTIKANTEDELLEKIYNWQLEKEMNSLEINPTLEKLFPEFLAHKKATTWSAATEKKNLSIWKKYYSTNEIIKVPLDDLKVKALREWAYDLIKRHDLTQKEYLNVATWMKQMLEFAEEEELIEKNFYPLLKITNKNVYRQIEEKPDENKVLTTEQELDLYRLCWKYYENNHFPVHSLVSLAIIMLFQLGLRPCEVCTLRYSDIEGDEIVVKRYYSEKGNTVMENRTKAGHGFRRILLTSLALDIIQETRKHHYENDNWVADYIFMTGENFKSFYDRMRKGGVAKTSAVNMQTFYDSFIRSCEWLGFYVLRPWVSFLISLVAVIVLQARRHPLREQYTFTFLMAAFYYLAYLLDTPAFDFRYFYPSLLLMMVSNAALMLMGILTLARKLKRKTGRV